MAKSLLIVALIFLGIWLLRKMFPVGTKPLSGTAKGPEELPSNNNAYAAVSIHSYKDRCTAAEQVAGHRFLSNEAPPLPLESCTSEKCHCVYMHHSDRRGGADRRVIHKPEETIVYAGYQNRRLSRCRRASDLALA
jgi:hypothetical protein